MMPAQVPAVDVDTAAEAPASTVLLDVREHDEWIRGHAPSATHIAMSELAGRLAELDRTKRTICICRSGNRSARVTSWLREQGFDAFNMTGGMSAWASFGHPIVNVAGDAGVVI
ncbi:MAG: rhodanese-like domain-containing protein [Ilumatobacteraceae bacterium]